jgi:hypothetical protein
MAIQLNYSSFNLSEDRSYSLLEIGPCFDLARKASFRFGYKTLVGLFLNQNVSARKPVLLSFVITAEYLLSPIVSFISEPGVTFASGGFLPSGESFGAGFSFIIGPRVYL